MRKRRKDGGVTEMNKNQKSKLWLLAVLACAVQATGWVLWIRYAVQHRVAEVPLATAR